jgi:hypothetical protein
MRRQRSLSAFQPPGGAAAADGAGGELSAGAAMREAAGVAGAGTGAPAAAAANGGSRAPGPPPPAPRPLPVSTQSILLPVSTLLRSASPAPGGRGGGGCGGAAEPAYAAAKAADAPLAKVLRRHWFAARRAVAARPGVAVVAVALVLLLGVLHATGALRRRAAWQVGARTHPEGQGCGGVASARRQGPH